MTVAMSSRVLSLQRGSPEFEKTLWTGRVVHAGEPWVAVPREVTRAIPSQKNPGTVIFELSRQEDLQRPSLWRVLYLAARPSLLGLTAAPCFTVIGYLWGKHPIRPMLALSAFLGVVFLQVACQASSDIEDFRCLRDLPGTWGGSTVLRKGWLTAQQLRRGALVTFLLAVGFGMPALLQGDDPWILWAAGGLAVLSGWAYVGKYVGLKYQKWGDALLFVLLGPGLTLGFSWAIGHFVDSGVIILGILFGSLSVSVARMHRLQNRTAFIPNSFQQARIFLMGLYLGVVLCVIFSVYFELFPWQVLIFFLPMIPVGMKIVRQLNRVSGPASALLNGLQMNAGLLHGGVGLCLGLGFLILKKII